MSISSSLLELSDVISSDSKEMDIDIVDTPLQENLGNIYFRSAAINIPVHEMQDREPVQFSPPCPFKLFINPFDEITADEIKREADLAAAAKKKEDDEEEEMARYLEQEFPDSVFDDEEEEMARYLEQEFPDSDFPDSDFSNEESIVPADRSSVRSQYPYNFSGVDVEYSTEDGFVSQLEIHNSAPASPESPVPEAINDDVSRYVVNYEIYTRPATFPESNMAVYPSEFFYDDFDSEEEE